jgi:hypothetical protein
MNDIGESLMRSERDYNRVKIMEAASYASRQKTG